MAGPYRYYSGGSNTAPYDTFAKGAPTLATIIAIPLAAGEQVRVANDTTGEALAVDTTYTFPGTAANPNQLVSVDRSNDAALLAGAIMSIASTKAIYLKGSVYIWGITFNLATTTGAGYLDTGYAQTVNNRIIMDTCRIVFVGTGSGSYLRFGYTTQCGTFLLKNSIIKYSNALQRVYCAGYVTFDGVVIDPAGSAITQLVNTNYGCGVFVIKNSDFSAAAQGFVFLPATATYSRALCIIENTKLPASWNGTLTVGDVVSSEHLRVEMRNCDSGDTNYRLIIIDYYGKLVQETILVMRDGATDGTTRLSWKIATTANANKFNPFECASIAAWNDTEGIQRIVSIETLCISQLTDSDIFLNVDFSNDTSTPLYSSASDRTADLIFTSAAAQTASTKNWSDLVTARANSTGYTLGQFIKTANSPGSVFQCTGAGNSNGSEPAGYTNAADGAIITDGTAQFTAMYRQVLSVTLPVGTPANKGWIIGTPKIGKASTTVYISHNLYIDGILAKTKMVPGGPCVRMDPVVYVED